MRCPSFVAVTTTALLVGTLPSPVDAFWNRRKTEEAKPEEKKQDEKVGPLEYGVDISFPMHHAPVSTNYAWLKHNVNPKVATPPEYVDMPLQPLGDMKAKYDHYIQGCVDYYNDKNGKGDRCVTGESDRLDMTLRQPQSVYNYTKLGFTKIKAPEQVFKLLKEFWDKNKDNQKPEKWATGNIYTNHWENSSQLISVEDASLEGGGYVLKQHIWNAARDTIEEWTGYRQAECSLYGIRVYKEGSMLAPHVDRLPLVSSAIINVDQDVDEPWPLEVIGHDGVAHNVTMEPGDLVLYESHSIIHGRPFPLKGRFMANVFIHFEPIQKIGGQVEYTGELPPYLIPGSPSEPEWRSRNPRGHQLLAGQQFTTGSTEAHHYASAGSVDKLRSVLDQHAELVNVRDQNGWTPLHEAVRNGDMDSIQLLVERGAELNVMAGTDGSHGSPMHMAKRFHGEDSQVTKLLAAMGAKDYRPAPGGEL